MPLPLIHVHRGNNLAQCVYSFTINICGVNFLLGEKFKKEYIFNRRDFFLREKGINDNNLKIFCIKKGKIYHNSVEIPLSNEEEITGDYLLEKDEDKIFLIKL